MSLLWRRGSGTVASLREGWTELYESEMSRTTMLTHLRRLRAKGWVEARREFQGYRYYPSEAPEDTRWLQLMRLTQLFYGGSREALLDYLVKDPITSRRVLEGLRETIEHRLAALRRAAPQRPARP